MEELCRTGKGFANVDGDKPLRQGLFAEGTGSADMNRHIDRQGSAKRHSITSQRSACQTEAGSEAGKSSLGMVRLCMQGQPWETASNLANKEIGTDWASNRELCRAIWALQKDTGSADKACIDRDLADWDRFCKPTQALQTDSLC